MKSIKEKAKEYVSDRPDGIIKTRVEEGYVAGANYVLEEIGKLINHKRWSAQDLYKVIDELKK